MKDGPSGILLQDVMELKACFRTPEQEAFQVLTVNCEADISSSSWNPDLQPVTITCPDGGVMAFEGPAELSPNGFKMFPKPGTMTYTPGPWRKDWRAGSSVGGGN